MTCFYCNKGHLTDDGRRTCGRLNHVDRAGGGQFIAKYVSDTHKCKQFEWKYISWGEIPGPPMPKRRTYVDKRHSVTIMNAATDAISAVKLLDRITNEPLNPYEHRRFYDEVQEFLKSYWGRKYKGGKDGDKDRVNQTN